MNLQVYRCIEEFVRLLDAEKISIKDRMEFVLNK
jgi:hypothetical protein